jgi:hypothetical protein
MKTNTITTEEFFETLSIPRKEIANARLSRYRVYETHSEFTVVEAESAADAFAKAGIARPQRIVRDSDRLDAIVSVQDEAVAPTPVAPPASVPIEPPAAAEPEESKEPALAAIEEPAEPAAPAEETAQSDAPLSDDEVNKLLQG